MKDLLYLKDDQIKDFIEQIFYAYRETYSDPKKILKKYSFGTAHHRAIHLIERHEGLTVSDLLNKLKITKQSLNRVLRECDGSNNIAVQMDITINKESKSGLNKIVNHFNGKIDSVIHCAGGGLGFRDPLIDFDDFIKFVDMFILITQHP